MSGVLFMIALAFTLLVLYMGILAVMVFGEFDKLNKRLDKKEPKEEP